MSDKNLSKLIPEIETMLGDHEIPKEFKPVLKELLLGCEAPNYDNIADVVEDFFNANDSYIFNQLAEGAFANAAMFGKPKKY